MKTLQEKTVEFSHRAALVEAATAVLNEYTPFKSHHRVSFHTDDTQPTPWILGQLERTDGTPIAGLYACGDNTRGIMLPGDVGVQYIETYLSAMTYAMCSGYLAAEKAIEFVEI